MQAQPQRKHPAGGAKAGQSSQRRRIRRNAIVDRQTGEGRNGEDLVEEIVAVALRRIIRHAGEREGVVCVGFVREQVTGVSPDNPA